MFEIIFDGKEISTVDVADIDSPVMIEITPEGVVLTKIPEDECPPEDY